MALAADGSLDTRKLQKEMVTALAEDIKYVKTDEMKKRAIKTARSYDEFKGMVACACLTPVSREDIDSLSKTKKGWVSTVTTKGKATTSVRRTQKQGVGGTGRTLGVSKGGKARSSMEFEREWRRMGKDPQERYRYLCSVGVGGLVEMFVSEMDASLMGDVIDTLHAVYAQLKGQGREGENGKGEGGEKTKEPGATQHVQGGEKGEGEKGLTEVAVGELWGLLSCLPQTGRFNLTFRFLSTQQRERAMHLIAELGGQRARGEGAGEEEVQALAEAFSKVQ